MERTMTRTASLIVKTLRALAARRALSTARTESTTMPTESPTAMMRSVGALDATRLCAPTGVATISIRWSTATNQAVPSPSYAFVLGGEEACASRISLTSSLPRPSRTSAGSALLPPRETPVVVSTSMATALSTPFYLDLGFSKTEIGLVAKNAALWPAIFGGLVGGVLMIRLGINRALWLFGAVQMASILGYAWLASVGPILWILAAVIGFEYLGVGLGTAAFTAFIARESSKTFAATQFALFTALAALPRSLANATTGVIVEHIGWVPFFFVCTGLAVPGMLLLFWVAPWSQSISESAAGPLSAAKNSDHNS